MASLDTFLEELRDCTDTNAYVHGDLERRAAEFACKGCGLGRKCDKDCDDSSCLECDDCNVGNYEKCTKKKYARSQCEDCFWCGCDKCELDDADYDGLDRYPWYEYGKRISNILTKLTDVLKNSSILDQWMLLLRRNTIKDYFPWETYSDYWRTHVFDSNNKIRCSMEQYRLLSNEDKPYFQNPIYNYASAYNVLRIMAGLGGLCYTSDTPQESTSQGPVPAISP